MILRNKRTREHVQLSYTEFQVKFAQEINTALESYIQTENNKSSFKINQNPESDFYFNLQWNFNHFSTSNWFIEKL
jgi:hypothetical protein